MSDVSRPADPERAAEAFGTAHLVPADDVVSGTYGSWTVTYRAGSLGMDDGGTVLVAFSQTSDLGRPQFTDPAADDFCSVDSTANVDVSARYDADAYVRPWKHAVRIDVTGGSLGPGEAVQLTFGDRSGGSLGLRAQSFPERKFRFPVLVDCHGTGQFEPVPGELAFDVIPGRAASLRAIAPSTVGVGEQVGIRVRAVDRWGNVDPDHRATLEVVTDSGDSVGKLVIEGGTGRTEVPIESPGVHRFVVRDTERDWSATSNPIEATERDRRIYWGDIHGQSGETVGTGTVQEYFAHARDQGFVDFAAHAGNDFQITETVWSEIGDAVREFHDPGTFVTIPCYEWSANTSLGGDHNVYFRGDDPPIHRSSSWQVADDVDRAAGTRPIEALYERYRGRDDVLIIPHQGGRPATLDRVDPALTPFVEIASVWGHFEWFGREALESGLAVGFVGGSDDHCGRPGDAPPDNLPKHNVSGGLMAAVAEDLDRESLWESFVARRVYATSGARIGLDLTVAGASMGAETVVDGRVQLEATVNGTAPVAGVDVFRGTELIVTRAFDAGDELVEIQWSGSRGRARDKLVDWSGGVAVDRGVIQTAEPFGFDHPEQGLVKRTPTEVRWDAATSGNVQGVRLAIDAPTGTTLTVGTATASLEVGLDSFDEPRTIDAGPVERRLSARPVGRPTSRDVEITWCDEDPPAGSHPYWVRARQVDGEVAWSSPTFVTVE